MRRMVTGVISFGNNHLSIVKKLSFEMHSLSQLPDISPAVLQWSKFLCYWLLVFACEAPSAGAGFDAGFQPGRSGTFGVVLFHG